MKECQKTMNGESHLKLPPKDADLSEKAKFFDSHPDLINPGYLNNFYAKLAGGFTRVYSEADEEKEKTKTLRQTMTENAKSDCQPNFEGMSDLRLDQTARQFFTAIDQASQEVGLDLSEIAAQNQQINQCNSEKLIRERIKVLAELEGKVLPLYKKLREMGYTHLDLVR